VEGRVWIAEAREDSFENVCSPADEPLISNTKDTLALKIMYPG